MSTDNDGEIPPPFAEWLVGVAVLIGLAILTLVLMWVRDVIVGDPVAREQALYMTVMVSLFVVPCVIGWCALRLPDRVRGWMNR